MTAYGSECFTMNEVNRLKILQDVIDGRLTTSLASQRLGLTDRHCRRLLARYRESGPLALANRRRGLRGNRQLVPGLAPLFCRAVQLCALPGYNCCRDSLTKRKI